MLFRCAVLSFAVAAVLATGCTREPLALLCTELAEGDLVVSEVSGDQGSGAPEDAQWFELYNASGAEIRLEGLELITFTLDGASEGRLVVRSPDLTVAAGDYVVLARAERGMEPATADYGYMPDFDRDPFDSAAVELHACGQFVERGVYRNLPGTGTLAVSGVNAPTAAGNEAEADWCIDPVGTPGEANLECP